MLGERINVERVEQLEAPAGADLVRFRLSVNDGTIPAPIEVHVTEAEAYSRPRELIPRVLEAFDQYVAGIADGERLSTLRKRQPIALRLEPE